MELKQFIHDINEFAGINSGDCLLVGVSGGIDSMCLMDLLQKSGFKLIIAHFNHHLREESTNDAQFVEKIAKQKGLDFIDGEADIYKIVSETRQSIEATARYMRYEFLFKEAEKNHAAAVVVGHTADDQVETILLHIIRGCGLDGLLGMKFISKTQFSSELPLIRPLLAWWRKDTLQYCQNNHLDLINDGSNLDIKFLRNRIRHELIPLLEKYNPGFKDHIINLSLAAALDKEFIGERVHDLYQNIIEHEETDLIKFSLVRFKEQSLVIQKRMIKSILGRLASNSEEINFLHINRAIKFIQEPGPSKHIDLFDGLGVFIEGESIYISRQTMLPLDPHWPQIAADFFGVLAIPGRLTLNQNWYLNCECASRDSMDKLERISGFNFTIFLDGDNLTEALEVRTVRPGEKYAPLGLNGKYQKISDFWINHKLPKRARANWPILLDGNQIAWIPGFQLAHDYRIKKDTLKIVKVELVNL